MIRVSVVIPHYGETGPTQNLITSLKRQRGLDAVEVIVADDHSPTPFPEGSGYRVVRRETNGGFGSAVNSGASVATGECLLVINSDVNITDDFVAALLAGSAAHQPCVAGPRIIEDGLAKVSTWRWPRVRGEVAQWLVPLARWHGHPALDRFWGADMDAHASEESVEVDWLVGACLMMPLVHFRAVGGFDERYFMNVEEVDLQRRLAERGVPARYVPTVTLHHEGGGSSDPSRRAGWLTDARFRYHHKWGGAGRLLVGLSAASVVNLVWNLGRRLRGGQVQPWRVFRREVALVGHGWSGRRGGGSDASPQ